MRIYASIEARHSDQNLVPRVEAPRHPHLCGPILMALALMCPAAALAQEDPVLTWNEIAVRTLHQQAQNPFAQARFAAIVQVAVFEAVNAITGDYEPYLGIDAPGDASVDAAAATAAFRVLKTYFPSAPDLDQSYAASLAAIPNGSSKSDGIATGEHAATAVMALRANDGSAPPMVSPVAAPDAGVWQLTLPPGCAVTATGGAFYQWQHVRPFGVADVLTFRPDPPPSLTSREFTKDYLEVSTMGRINSTERPQDRSDVARFFNASSPTLVFNQAARQIAAAEHRSSSENARMLALLTMATNDALVASFAAKYHYNFWRPETAIRFADFYGNVAVTPDPTFVPFITTPCFPSYPSNHASGSGAAAEILRRILGEGGHDIRLSNPFNAAVAHMQFTYSRFNELCDDIDDARVFGGIHFRFDQVGGSGLGRQVATSIYKSNLRKVNDTEE